MSTTSDKSRRAVQDGAPAKPLPIPDSDSRPFWDGCKAEKLRLQQCSACGEFQFYPRAICRHCASEALDWQDVSGEGEIYSFTVARRPAGPAFAADVPYVVAIVRLDEGPRLMTNIVTDDIAGLRIGARVRVVFERMSAEITLPKFTPV